MEPLTIHLTPFPGLTHQAGHLSWFSFAAMYPTTILFVPNPQFSINNLQSSISNVQSKISNQ
jgi:hypothetical protein